MLETITTELVQFDMIILTTR